MVGSWRRRLGEISREFWFYPSLLTALSLVLAQLMLSLDRRVVLPPQFEVIYDGGVDGARGVLTAIATSMIAVAGTTFSITVAALSYTAASMGPRLLTNFTRDRGNQLTLATFLATFAFSLYSLRAVGVGSGVSGDGFVPHLNVSVAIGLAMLCVAMLVFFISHVTRSISTSHVIGLLRDDLESSLRTQLSRADRDEDRPTYTPPTEFWESGERLTADAGGYLQHVELARLLEATRADDCALQVTVRPGDYIFPGSVVAVGVPHLPEGVLSALTTGSQRVAGQDVEFTVRQMTEVAVRALSPGINDPFTAVEVIDRFGDVLCELAEKPWQTGVFYDDTRLRLVHRTTTFDGLVGAMFTQVRQNGLRSLSVLIRMLEVLSAVVAQTQDEGRRKVLVRHAELVYEAGNRSADVEPDAADLRERLAGFRAAVEAGRRSAGT